MSSRGRRLRNFLLVAAVFALVVLLSASLWLPSVGRLLVYSDAVEPADCAVVLGGDPDGYRITAAAELARTGVVPLVLVRGPQGMSGINEADAAIHFITSHGYDGKWFAAVRHKATSTRAEADILLAEMERRGMKSFLLVTSNFHTRRSRRIFLGVMARRGDQMKMTVLATGDANYRPDSWWRSREGLKTAFYEWTKTVTSVVGM